MWLKGKKRVMVSPGSYLFVPLNPRLHSSPRLESVSPDSDLGHGWVFSGTSPGATQGFWVSLEQDILTLLCDPEQKGPHSLTLQLPVQIASVAFPFLCGSLCLNGDTPCHGEGR